MASKNFVASLRSVARKFGSKDDGPPRRLDDISVPRMIVTVLRGYDMNVRDAFLDPKLKNVAFYRCENSLKVPDFFIRKQGKFMSERRILFAWEIYSDFNLVRLHISQNRSRNPNRKIPRGHCFRVHFSRNRPMEARTLWSSWDGRTIF